MERAALYSRELSSMKLYKYCEPCGDKYITEQQIIEQYFPYWSKQMDKVGRKHLINYKNCIEDFCVVHWGFEVEEYGK